MGAGKSRSRFGNGLALLVPVLAIGALEGGLRLAGYGSDYPLFVPSPEDARYLMPNPAIIERYFPARFAPALSIRTNYFLNEKPRDGIRIFVQGESTAAGFPFESGAALSDLLEYRLGYSFPDRPVEVVDTAMSAVSSFMLLDFADEIVDREPDAVLVYAGHNEFVGLLGAGSVVAGPGMPAITRLTLTLQRFRLYQLARHLYARGRSAILGPPPPEGTTLMAQLARTQEVPLDSETFRHGIEQWRENLSALVERYTEAGIPVFIATVASNLKDQPPFVSVGLPDAVAEEVARTLDLVRGSNFDAIAPAALARLETLAAVHGSAELYFTAGIVHEWHGNYDRARRTYELARDHDLLRFRAPTAINDVTIEIARITAAELVDVSAAFDAASPNGLVGEELMLEHLHPNVDGYLLLADAFYRSLAGAAVPAPFPVMHPAGIAREEVPVFPAEIWFAQAVVAELKSDFPFSATKRTPELPPVRSASDALGRAWFNNEIDWLELAEASRDLVADQPLQRAIASQRIADALPFRRDLAERAAADWLAAGRPRR